LRAENVGLPGGGVRRVFDVGQLERARLLNALLKKGVSLAHLAAAADLDFDGAQFVVYDGYDGRELRACRDAGKAIATVAKQPPEILRRHRGRPRQFTTATE